MVPLPVSERESAKADAKTTPGTEVASDPDSPNRENEKQISAAKAAAPAPPPTAAPDAREPPFESVPEAMPEALPSESEAPAFTPDEDRVDAVSESEAPAPALATLGNS